MSYYQSYDDWKLADPTEGDASCVDCDEIADTDKYGDVKFHNEHGEAVCECCHDKEMDEIEWELGGLVVSHTANFGEYKVNGFIDGDLKQRSN